MFNQAFFDNLSIPTIAKASDKSYEVILNPYLTMMTIANFYFFAVYKYWNTPPETHAFWAGLIVLYFVLVFIGFKGWTTMEKKESKKIK